MRNPRRYPTLLELLRRGRGGALAAGGALVLAGNGCGSVFQGTAAYPDLAIRDTSDVAGDPGSDAWGEPDGMGRDVLPVPDPADAVDLAVPGDGAAADSAGGERSMDVPPARRGR